MTDINPLLDPKLARVQSLRRLFVLFGYALAVVFASELAIMFALPLIFPAELDATLEAFVDASLLTLILGGVLLPLMLRYRRQMLREGQRAIRLNSVLDRHAIVSVADRKGVITYVNSLFCEVSGYSRGELIGQNHRIVKSDEHGPEVFNDMWRTITRGEIWSGDVCNRRKDGGRYWVHATIKPFMGADGKIEEYVSIRTEITAQKALERTLEKQYNHLNTILENLGEGVYTLDVDGKVTYLNPAGERLLGWTLGELVGRGMHRLTHHHRADGSPLSGAECPIYLALREGQVFRSNEELLFRKDGTPMPVKMVSAPLMAREVMVGSVAVFDDIAEQREMQASLVAAKDAAEQANEAKSNFLSSMSHELRTPMNAILGFAQMLESDPALNEDQHDSVHEILKGGRHLLDLINEVLDLAKIESGRLEVSLEPVLLAQVIEDCRQFIQPLAMKRSISLTLESLSGVAIRADRVRIKQVLLNLLSNAVKYNRAGGDIRLGVTPRANDRWRVSVTDTGDGIPPARLAELFQPFNRLDAELSSVEGTGIGLTITKKLVELMDGVIGVDSQVGVGSVFWVDLPNAECADPVKGGGHAGAAQTLAELKQCQVLCVDDNPVNLKLIAQMLGRRGGLVLHSAHTPELGLELALAHRPDLILLDINMPGMDGFQVLKIMQADARLKTIPVIAVTANAMPRDIERGRAAGFADYVTKPLEFASFNRIIDSYLGLTEAAAK
jgi:PAS domain S-box-containing protein